MPLRTKTSLIIDELLKLVALTGSAALTVVAPNSLLALEKPLKKIIKKLDKSVDSRKVAYYAKRLAVVDVAELSDGNFEIRLNAKGKSRVLMADFENLKVGPQANWDQRWRLVVYDIPEEFRNSRMFLAEKLKSMGFYMLQKSLWVHPFPCLEQIALIKHVLPEVAPFIALIETESIDQHNRLVRHFTKTLPL